MDQVSLILGETVFPVSGLALRQSCTRFATDPLPPQYLITSNVSAEVVQIFISSLNGESPEITKANFPSLSILCNEFGFKIDTPTYRLGEVELALNSLRNDINQLIGDLSAQQGTTSVLKGDVSILKGWTQAPESQILFPPQEEPLNSRLISDFREIFAEFRCKRFSLLWRGSRDGFGAKEFHRRCDGHANTLTVVLDTEGNVFGGFTPVEWESRLWNRQYSSPQNPLANNLYKADDEVKSCLFTLRNPNEIGALRFPLKREHNFRALCVDVESGPRFYELWIWDNCNENTNSFTGGPVPAYMNNTGVSTKTVFTGSEKFKVKEI